MWGVFLARVFLIRRGEDLIKHPDQGHVSVELLIVSPHYLPSYPSPAEKKTQRFQKQGFHHKDSVFTVDILFYDPFYLYGHMVHVYPMIRIGVISDILRYVTFFFFKLRTGIRKYQYADNHDISIHDTWSIFYFDGSIFCKIFYLHIYFLG